MSGTLAWEVIKKSLNSLVVKVPDFTYDKITIPRLDQKGEWLACDRPPPRVQGEQEWPALSPLCTTEMEPSSGPLDLRE